MKRSALVLLILATFCLINATDVGGSQSGTWTLANSPYNLVAEVTILSGTNLTIEPGVTVNATGPFRINTLGSLTAVGTPADTIRFMNTMASTTAYWPGIRLENVTALSTIQYCYIERASYGVHSVGGMATISHSRFKLNEKGVHCNGVTSSNMGDILITHCIFEGSPHNGILVTQYSNVEISYNEIRYNGTGPQYRGAIQLANQSAGGLCNPLIHHNHIHHNLKQGITAWDVASVNAINPIIHNNLIENNLTGIYLRYSSGYLYENTVINNFIVGDMNSGAGLMISGSLSVPYLERNIISGNYTGLYITENAMPILGDLSIYHAWAQGENIIRNNVDANGARHSVFCTNYTAANNVIKCENNYWDANDAAGIAADIMDHNDDPALPYVDFEPWLDVIEPTLVNGSWAYTGTQQIVNPRLQIVGTDNGAVLHEVPVTTANFAISLAIGQPFFAAMLATASSDGRTLYGIAGGMDTPTVFTPSDLLETFVGNIEITDIEPFRYETVGAASIEEGHTVYPMHNGFFVYAGDWTNYLYRDGDYLKLLKHSRKLANGHETWILPEAQRLWAKTSNVLPGDTWTRYMIADTLGTIRSSVVNVNAAAADQADPLYLLKKEFNDDGMISQSINTAQERLRFTYTGLDLSRVEKINDWGVEPDGSSYPLVTGNTWILKPQQLQPHPSYLFFDPIAASDTNDRIVNLYFQPPKAGSGWTHYRVYRNGVILSEFLVDQIPDYHWLESLSNNTPSYTYSICAWNGSQESEHSNAVTIQAVANDDNIQLPPQLAVYPNPFGRAGIKIELSNPKAKTAAVEIFNLRGQLVRTVVISGEDKISWTWDAKDSSAQACGAGIYFIRLSQPNADPISRRVVLVD